MNCIFWNVCGINSSVNRLISLTKANRVDFVAILEPMAKEHKVNTVRMSLGFTNCATALNNKLWVFWRGDRLILTQVQEFTQMYTCHFWDSNLNTKWSITSVYGKHTGIQRRELWSDLINNIIKEHFWIVGGDFNAISSLDEHKGATTPSLADLNEFKDCTEAIPLLSPPFSGGIFTWSGVRSRGKIWRRLDRALVNTFTMNFFTEINIKHCSKASSDHKALILLCTIDNYTGAKPFRSQDFWIRRISERDILFTFKEEKDYIRLIQRRYWYVEKYHFYVFKWTRNYKSSTDCPIFPVWVTLHGLPLHLIDYQALFSIASLLGKPIMLDDYTVNRDRRENARFCVEMDTSLPPPPMVHIRLGANDLFLKCSYEKFPPYCSTCLKFGHKSGTSCAFFTGKAPSGEGNKGSFESINVPADSWIKVTRKKSKPVQQEKAPPSVKGPGPILFKWRAKNSLNNRFSPNLLDIFDSQDLNKDPPNPPSDFASPLLQISLPSNLQDSILEKQFFPTLSEAKEYIAKSKGQKLKSKEGSIISQNLPIHKGYLDDCLHTHSTPLGSGPNFEGFISPCSSDKDSWDFGRHSNDGEKVELMDKSDIEPAFFKTPSPCSIPLSIPCARKKKYFDVTRTIFTRKLFSHSTSIPLGKVEGFYKGIPSASFTYEEEGILAENFKFAVIGRSSQELNLQGLKAFLLKGGFNGGFKIRRVSAKTILFIFTQEADYVRFLRKQNWFVGSAHLHVCKWSKNLNMSFDNPVVPIWVTFKNLPLHFISFQSLFTLASTIGRPIQLDEKTANLDRGAEARVLIERDLSLPFPNSVHLRIGDKDLIIPCQRESYPDYCTFCKKFGHNCEGCKNLTGKANPGKGKKAEQKEDGAYQWNIVKGKKTSTTRKISSTHLQNKKRWVRKEGTIAQTSSHNTFNLLDQPMEPISATTIPTPAEIIEDLFPSLSEAKAYAKRRIAPRSPRNSFRHIPSSLDDCLHTSPDIGLGILLDSLENHKISGEAQFKFGEQRCYFFPFAMNCIFWNVCGINSSVNRLISLTKANRVDFVAILEPMAKEHKVNTVRMSLGFTNCATALNNKLWVFWRGDRLILTQVQEFTQMYTCHFWDSNLNTKWSITSVYGKHTGIQRRELWSDLINNIIKEHFWIVGGDFNAISSLDEHKGATTPSLADLNEFKDCTEAIPLLSPPFSGGIFTWSGVRSRGKIWRRLDRALVNTFTMNFFTEINIKHCSKASSDHKALILLCTIDNYTGAKPFRSNPRDELRTLVNKANAELIETTNRETQYWKQKAHIKWMELGDQSTSYFHSYVKGRRSALKITSILDGNGKKTLEVEAIKKEAEWDGGEFTLKQGYNACRESGNSQLSYKLAWHKLQIPSVKIFQWKILHDILPFPRLYIQIGFHLHSQCPLCKSWETNVNHTLLHCEFSINIWNFFANLLQGPRARRGITLRQHFLEWGLRANSKTQRGNLRMVIPGIIAWNIWKIYTASIYNEDSPVMSTALKGIKTTIQKWNWLHRKKSWMIRDQELYDTGFEIFSLCGKYLHVEKIGIHSRHSIRRRGVNDDFTEGISP
ncbi:hypothetical protein DM860_015583 [Cuscuta australis]|uniref:DUF4283 domain-containing protein n=1 Tax=Cuscuta australis TaxID=267555 RepID=A0A328E850_9ASTE|nr:hypothetical protein DM860_015583 [Cuscuta australis]